MEFGQEEMEKKESRCTIGQDSIATFFSER
jgi:hypothetical protein